MAQYPSDETGHPVEQGLVLGQRQVVEESVAPVEEAVDPARRHVRDEVGALVEVQGPAGLRLADEGRDGEDPAQIIGGEWALLHLGRAPGGWGCLDMRRRL